MVKTEITAINGYNAAVVKQSGRVGQFLSDRPEFVRINRSEIINVRHVTRFIGNMYFIDRQELVATGIYRERMRNIFRLLERKK